MTVAVGLRLVVAVVLLDAAGAQDARPLPEPRPFFDAVRANLARAQDEQKRFAYKERRTSLDLNPFGHIGTGGTRVIAVTPIEDGNAVMRQVLERDGMPVNSTPVRRAIKQTERGKSIVDDLVAIIEFTMDRREMLDGRETIVLTFKPKPDAKPKTREGGIARAFAGQIWIDEEAREVAKVDATAIDDLSFGYGVLGRLNEGATVSVRRQRIDGDLWLPSSIRFSGEGRALLFLRKLTINFAVDWYDYRRTSS